MSTPVDIGTLLGNVLSAIADAFNTVVSVISENIGTIVSLALLGGIVALAVKLVGRYTREFSGMFRAILPF